MRLRFIALAALLLSATVYAGLITQSGPKLYVDESPGGPLFVHVYETAGTYTAKVRACYDEDADGTCESGEWSQDEVTITVASPGTTYSGTSTICLSRNTDHTGCPSGATQSSSVSSWPSWASNRRYLLHAGQDFSSLGDISVRNVEQSQWGKYGSGDDPIVGGIELENTNPATQHTVWSNRLVFMDLQTSVTGVRSNSHNLFLRLTISGNVTFLRDGWEDHSSLEWPHHLYFVENTIAGDNYGFIGSGGMHCFVGNEIWTTVGSDGHNIRSGFNYKGVYAHNLLRDNQSSGRHYIKLHSHGYDTYPESTHLRAGAGDPMTKYIVITDNVLGPQSPDVISWAIAVSPQYDGAPEALEDVIVENNLAVRNYSTEVVMGGRRMTDRSNANTTGSWNSSEDTHTAPSGYNGPYFYGAVPTSDPT
jgi:hypothetical protein